MTRFLAIVLAIICLLMGIANILEGIVTLGVTLMAISGALFNLARNKELS